MVTRVLWSGRAVGIQGYETKEKITPQTTPVFTPVFTPKVGSRVAVPDLRKTHDVPGVVTKGADASTFSSANNDREVKNAISTLRELQRLVTVLRARLSMLNRSKKCPSDGAKNGSSASGEDACDYLERRPKTKFGPMLYSRERLCRFRSRCWRPHCWFEHGRDRMASRQHGQLLVRRNRIYSGTLRFRCISCQSCEGCSATSRWFGSFGLPDGVLERMSTCCHRHQREHWTVVMASLSLTGVFFCNPFSTEGGVESGP